MTIAIFLNKVNEFILNPLIALMFALSFLYFTYGVVKFLRLEAGDTTRKEAQASILWGIVGMLIMFSVYGIIQYLIMPSFGISSSDIKSPDALNVLKL